MDPTSIIPEKLKEKLADSLVELLAGSAERLGGDQIAGKIRKLSSRGELLQSIDRALEAGIRRFIKDYMSQDEDLVEAIQADDIFWQSEMVQDALVKLVSRPSAWLGEERETMLRHFETVLPTRVNRERVDKAVSFLLRCIAEELWSLPGAHEIREAYSVQFQELSAEAQREGVALARQQLQATTQLSADLRQTLLQLVALVEQKMLAAPAPVAVLASPRPYHNLPQPTYTQFVGRDEELTWLRQRLLPADRAWQVAITGIGGVGKSALALTVAHEYRQRYNELPPEERFEAIVWVSAKEEVLTAYGRERANVSEQVLHTLEDVYTAIARVLEREDITRAQPEDQYALVEKALKRQRVLLIMDNLESIKDDRIKAFLRNLPPPTKAIITSREGLDVADVKPLTGLPWEKAEALIEEECRVRELSLTPQQRKRIFELTSGLPLPIKLGIARMAGGESFALVERWLGDATGELSEYCVKGQIDLVSRRDSNAWMVLLACALFDREAGASREALGYIADLSIADRDSALAQLFRFFLVNRSEGDRFSVLPIVERYSAAQFPADYRAQSLVERWVMWLEDFAQTCGAHFYRDEKLWRATRVEYANLRNGIIWCQGNQRWRSLLRIAEGTYPYMYRVGLFAESEGVLEMALSAAATLSDHRARGQILVEMGLIAWLRGKEGIAVNEFLREAEEIALDYQDHTILFEIWNAQADIQTRAGHHDEAAELAHRIMEAASEGDHPNGMFLGTYSLALVERNRNRLEQAETWLNQAESWAEKLEPARRPHRLASVLYLRAHLRMREGDLVQAESLLVEALQTSESIGEARFIAYDKQRLAEVCLSTGRVQVDDLLGKMGGSVLSRY